MLAPSLLREGVGGELSHRAPRTSIGRRSSAKVTYLALIVVLFFIPCFYKNLHAQELLSVHPHSTGQDTVWYSDVDEKSKPESMFCDPGGVGFFRYKISESRRLISDYKKDTIETDKTDWNEEDENAFDEAYNEEHQAELDKLLDSYDEDRQDIGDLADEAIDYIVFSRWDTPDFGICIPNCLQATMECYTSWEITQITDAVTKYQYKTSFAWHTENDSPPHTVEIDFDLYIHYEAWVWFKVTCACEEIPGLMTVPPEVQEEIYAMFEGVDLTGAHMKLVPALEIPVDKPFPWIPVGAGVAGGTIVTYLLIDKDKPADCSFSARAEATISICNLPNATVITAVSPPDDYSYLWSNGSNAAMLSNVPVGTYTVTITRNNTSCTQIVSATVTNVNPPFNPTTSVISAHCGENDGAISITVDPPAQYTFEWSNGSTGPNQSNLAPGDYMVTITSMGSCSLSFNVGVGVLPPQFIIDIVPIPASCGMEDGGATTSVDPPGDYEYLWSNGSTSPNLANVPAGEYQLSVTISNTNCQKTTSIVIPQHPADYDLTFTTTPAGCGNSDGSTTVSVDPPGTYVYIWSDGTSGPELSGVTAGEYQVTVTLEGTSCEVAGSVIIDENPADFTLTFTTIPSGCGGSDGSATVEVDQPGTYHYLWSNGAAGAELTGVPSGEYHVTVTLQGTSCQVTGSVLIGEETPDFVPALSSTPATCGIADGTAMVSVEPPGTYNYIWSNGATTESVTDLTAGEYILTVSNSGGCEATAMVTVEETPAEFITQISSVPGNCIGDGGDIMLETQTHGDGPMQITATGPDGTHVFSSPAGMVNLSTFFTVLPGAWQIAVRDMSLPDRCVSETGINVEDNTEFSALDDLYETTVDQPVDGNVLDNDAGISLKVGDHTEPAGGTLVLNEDGSFTFTPPPGESGEFMFQYMVMDTCGNSTIRNVTIHVTSLDCLFEVTFDVTPSHCGLMNGAITTMLMPPGNYTFIWSDGQSTQDLIDIGAGQYQVTVTSVDLMCDHTYNVQVDEVPNVYITNISTSPGNCTGEGDIHITLETPGDGPLVLEVDGPEGSTQFSLFPGAHNLSSSMNIPSGDYSITVYDEGAGPGCDEFVEITVPDNTPALTPQEDFYQTPFNTPVDGNVLDNDDGLDITLTDVFDIVSGTVDFFANGFFTFTPEPTFSGTATFEYVVTDACGNEEVVHVEIIVEEPVCDFTAEFNNTNASCGLSDGNSIVAPDPPGNYTYVWSNGVVGPDIGDVMAGMYDVTITDQDLGCDLTFGTEILENPAMYISDVVVTQPMCPNDGEITFDVSSPVGGPFNISVAHPNGNDNFIVPQGNVVLSDHISITAGEYAITVIDLNAGPSCVDGFEATIDPGPMIVIAVEAIIPPTMPSSTDGSIIVAIMMAGTPPYTILLNDAIWGVTSENPFTIEGLGAADYTIQIQDVNGCLSNLLEVTVPLPPGNALVEFGFGLIAAPLKTAPVPEPVEGPVTTGVPFNESNAFLNSFISLGLHYPVNRINHETSVLVIPQNRGNGMHYRVNQLVEMWKGNMRGFNIKAQGGLSIDVLGRDVVYQSWTLRGSVRKEIGRLLKTELSVGMMGWERVRGIEVGAILVHGL